MTIYFGADHRGFELKTQLKVIAGQAGHRVVDLGNTVLDSADDYPDFAARVAEKVSIDSQSRGVVICGSGVGVDEVANKFQGVRSALAISKEQIAAARQDDDVNVLSLAADFTDAGTAADILKTFLATPFVNVERHRRRIEKISKLE